MRRKRLAPLTLLALFVLTAGIPLATVVWLGWRLLDQDRVLEVQRLRDQLDAAAALTVRELDRSLTAWSDLLIAAAGGQSVPLPVGATYLEFQSQSIVAQQGVRLPYYPRAAPMPDLDATLFAAAETQEFRNGSLGQAAVLYRTIARSTDTTVRAAALTRLARVLRKQQRSGEAFAVYGALAELGATPVAGATAVLVARRERVVLLNATNDNETERERRLLEIALFDGHARIDRPTFDFYGETLALRHAVPESARRALALAEAVEDLWPRWLNESEGRAGSIVGEASFVAVWRRSKAGTAALVAPLDDFMTGTQAILRNLDVRLALELPSGRLSWGSPIDDRNRVTRTAPETNLPWNLHVALVPSDTAGGTAASRRNLFTAGLGAMLLVVGAAAYVVFRAVRHELAIARLQSDFVAAVSHEFRTPLTAMCHLTEMLEDGTTPPERWPVYYRALGRESRRLRGIVEGLLDFGRIDAGRREYLFVETDAIELVDQVVQECRDRSPASAHRLQWQPPSCDRAPVRIRADREALALALRNLVDNASKYSPETSPVKVSVEPQANLVGIAVEDHGLGIPAEEQRAIFRKFARGSAARRLNVKGTGIGLTMAQQIVKAHGGRLELKSTPGHGTTFTARLPQRPVEI